MGGLAALVLVVTVVGCTQLPRGPLAPPTTISPSAGGSAARPSGVRTGATGNVIKDIGEWGMLLDSAGSEAVKLRVTKIDPAFVCTGDASRTPAHGRFIGVWMDIYTTEGAVLGSGDPLYFNTTDWHITSRYGTEQEDPFGNSAGCAADPLPAQLVGGQHVQGVVVLDSADEHSALPLVPEYTTGGWEWNF